MTYRESSCTGKVRYETKSAAKCGVKVLRKRQPQDRFDIYPCVYCGMFHVGHRRPDLRLEPLEAA